MTAQEQPKKLSKRQQRQLERERQKAYLDKFVGVRRTQMGSAMYKESMTRIRSARAGFWLGIASTVGVVIIGPLAFLCAVIGLPLSLKARRLARSSYKYDREGITAGIVLNSLGLLIAVGSFAFFWWHQHFYMVV